MQRAGYRIAPVNPGAAEILGETCYPSLAAIPSIVAVDVVDVFRRSDAVPAIVAEAIERGAPTLWLQLGVTHPDAEERARRAGLTVVSNRCIKVVHRMRFPAV